MTSGGQLRRWRKEAVRGPASLLIVGEVHLLARSPRGFAEAREDLEADVVCRGGVLVRLDPACQVCAAVLPAFHAASLEHEPEAPNQLAQELRYDRRKRLRCRRFERRRDGADRYVRWRARTRIDQVFTVRALSPEQARVLFEQRQPPAPDEPPTHEYIIDVRVQE